MKNYQHLKILIMICLIFTSMARAADDVKEWTFLLFLNGNNNLDSFGDVNLKQMEEVGSSKNINLVVQWGSMSRKTVKRLYIKKSNNSNQVTSPVVQDIGAVDMGDYKELVKFLKWGHEKYPAKRYFVSVWNHGNGWHKNKALPGGIQINDISYDDKTGNKITTEQLGIAMGEFSQILGRKVDLYGSDACLMSMVEVASEMSDYVSYFAGSQEVEPGYGWPYSTFIKEWTKSANIEGDKLGTVLAKEYLKAYSGGIYGQGNVTFSVLNLNKIAPFENAIANLAQDMKSLSATDLNHVFDLSKQTQNFTYSDYKDFSHFFKFLDASNLLSEKTNLNVTQSFNDFVISNQVSASYSDAKGVSIWLPESSWQFGSYQERYSKLKFNQRTQWLDFLNKLPLN